MHHTLEVAEILESIFSHLDPSQDFWGDTALDLLWSHQTLGNVIRCLPADLWTLDEVTSPGAIGPHREMRLLRPVVETDWERPRVYTRRIKSLNFGAPWIGLYEVFPDISLCFPRDLFPQLQRFEWRVGDCDPSYVPLFACSTLVELSLGHPIASILSIFAQKCPALRDIAIDALDDLDAPNSNAIEDVSTFVGELRSIRSITVHSLNWKALEHLVQIPALVHLDLIRLPTTLPPILDVVGICTLQKLRIKPRAQIRPLTAFFRLFRNAPLASIDVYSFPADATVSDTSNLYSALAAGCAHTFLTELKLDASTPDNRADTDKYIIRGSSIRILFCFHNLMEVYIRSPYGLDMDADTVDGMARAWPRIQSLRFTSFTCLVTPLPIHCLLSFAQHCPDLAFLEMPLDATSIPDAGSPPGLAIDVSHRRLYKLYTPHSPIRAPYDVQIFLTALFPNLLWIETDRTGDDNESDDAIRRYGAEIAQDALWMEVETGLQASVDWDAIVSGDVTELPRMPLPRLSSSQILSRNMGEFPMALPLPPFPIVST
ncbi:hypothetical protein B0H17DRAFT_1136154 [Mycena rosella]|uniref:F-box domain-containing protein n=1 Tax=Mycena rosella TaxID=1033263 RepID=A0AAD7DBH6_MYCRO|nr:hypothetical protein B0H17DRAFT_1136154 [Mycena rosella]